MAFIFWWVYVDCTVIAEIASALEQHLSLYNLFLILISTGHAGRPENRPTG